MILKTLHTDKNVGGNAFGFARTALPRQKEKKNGTPKTNCWSFSLIFTIKIGR